MDSLGTQKVEDRPKMCRETCTKVRQRAEVAEAGWHTGRWGRGTWQAAGAFSLTWS